MTNQNESPEEELYRLTAGDILEIHILNEENLGGEYPLDGAGNIHLPYIGKVDLLDLSVSQARQKITDMYAADYYRYPHITVKIKQYRPFFLIGGVGKPGQYPYMENMTVLSAIAMAGGYTPFANKSGIKITRQHGSDIRIIPAQLNTRIMPGDIIDIAEKRH